jgi:hypothetical protein
MPNNRSVAEYLRTIIKVKRQLVENMLLEIQQTGYSKSTKDRLESRIETYNELLSELDECERLTSNE